jgi:hypothetical protein
MAVPKKLQKEKAKLELVWQLTEAEPDEIETRVNRAFDILFESVLATYPPQEQPL